MNRYNLLWLLAVIVAAYIVIFSIPMEIGYILTRFEISNAYWWAFGGFYAGLLLFVFGTVNERDGGVFNSILFAFIITSIIVVGEVVLFFK